MKLILFATAIEASATICYTKAQADPSSYATIWQAGTIPTIYRYDGGTIVITNIGLHAAAAAFTKHYHTHTEIYNIGFAGALHDQLPLLELVSIKSVDKWCITDTCDDLSKRLSSYCVPKQSLATSGYALISSDTPLHHDFARKTLAKQGYDLVDMESYAIAYLASQLQMPYCIWKIVSDFASPGGRELMLKYTDELSHKIAQHLIDKL